MGATTPTATHIPLRTLSRKVILNLHDRKFSHMAVLYSMAGEALLVAFLAYGGYCEFANNFQGVAHSMQATSPTSRFFVRVWQTLNICRLYPKVLRL